MAKVIIIMGSKADVEHAKKITEVLKKFNVDYTAYVASAHKTPKKTLEILEKYEDEENIVFITIAGRSNALSGFVDANTVHPVIACPPYGEKFSGFDIFSTLRMPSGVAPLTVLEPEAAAIAAVKILGVANKGLKEKMKSYHANLKMEIEKANESLEI